MADTKIQNAEPTVGSVSVESSQSQDLPHDLNVREHPLYHIAKIIGTIEYKQDEEPLWKHYSQQSKSERGKQHRSTISSRHD